MAYKPDQGRYARMLAFWALFALVAYGCMLEFRFSLNRWLGAMSEGLATPWAENFPLLGTVNLATMIAIAIVIVFGVVLHRVLQRPKIADLLIETELEMRKVTWPTTSDTVHGTLAVIVTVAIMLVFLTFADFAVGFLVNALLTRGATS